MFMKKKEIQKTDSEDNESLIGDLAKSAMPQNEKLFLKKTY